MTDWKHEKRDIFKAGNTDQKKFEEKMEAVFKKIAQKNVTKKTQVLEMLENELSKREILILYDIANSIINKIRCVLDEGKYYSDHDSKDIEIAYY